MRFRNTASNPLDFKLAGQRYDVPVGGEVELPDKLTDIVRSRRLPLEPIPGTDGSAPEPKRDDNEAPPKGTPARLWYDRAHAVRAAHEALLAQNSAMLDSLSEERAEAQAKVEQLEAQLAEAATFPAKVRERLGIGPEDSILTAIDTLRSDLAKALEAATKPAPAPRPRSGGSAPASPTLPIDTTKG